MVSWASSLTSCAVVVLLVVSWWSWDSQTFSPLMLLPCVSAAPSTAEAGAAMEALAGPAHLDTDIVTASVSLYLLLLFLVSCVKMVFGVAVQCSPCSLCLFMHVSSPMYVLDWHLLAGSVGDGNFWGFYIWCIGSFFSYLVAYWALSLFMKLPPPHPRKLPASFALDGTSTMDAIQLLLFLSWCFGSHFSVFSPVFLSSPFLLSTPPCSYL